MMVDQCKVEGGEEVELNSFQIINCLQPIKPDPKKKLVYIKAHMDEELMVVMADSSTTSNFMAVMEA